ncbi:ABC transporter ATP-binding protein [Sporolactobacillus shoreicorticis]|uniref:ABC transporter ATP-binding protein n=1 Tax=Sporolactobacillus shoreicorticis TaxID=1923877 RepID=A0ABW5S5X7_9BACL|nr:ABC transporter ATP-binding protein [Sporolactobacillus shoreicorticis]MCO7126194.1 ABC transporter ATP-binding protein [Sporolactobacillus shoreicorticis]
MKSVELIDVTKTYGNGSVIIKNLNLSIQSGEFFVLVGPSGCGKSTILRMIAGLEGMTSGTLLIGGKPANLLPPSKRSLSMVFQNYALYPHLTARENIIFGLKAHRIGKDIVEKRLREAAEMLNLAPCLDRKPRQLSGGQRQRIALARSIVSEAPICLMDEPLSNLDAKLRARMRSEIRRIQRKIGTTMIYVTHDQIEAMTMGDRMAVLHDGTVQQIGRPIDVYNHPDHTFVASFIGSPQMNLMPAVYDDVQKILRIGASWTITRELPIAGGEVILGIRPENIHPATHPASAQNKAIHFSANIIDTEILGNETQLTFLLDHQTWTAKWEGQWTIPDQSAQEMVILPENLLVFDRKDGHILYDPKRSQKVEEVTV